MRAISDSAETIVEFAYDTVTYRLILPLGRRTFYLDVLAPDEHRPWMGRWSRYAMGRHDWTQLLRHERIYSASPLPASLLEEIHRALEFAATGKSETWGHA